MCQQFGRRCALATIVGGRAVSRINCVRFGARARRISTPAPAGDEPCSSIRRWAEKRRVLARKDVGGVNAANALVRRIMSWSTTRLDGCGFPVHLRYRCRRLCGEPRYLVHTPLPGSGRGDGMVRWPTFWRCNCGVHGCHMAHRRLFVGGFSRERSNLHLELHVTADHALGRKGFF